MIYITIILVAIIIACCILGCRYIAFKNNPKMYETYNAEYITNEVNSLLEKYTLYETVDEKEQYKYHVSDKQVIDSLHRILMYLNNEE